MELDRDKIFSRIEADAAAGFDGNESAGLSPPGWVVARTDWFGPTIYLTDDKRWVFGDDAMQAHVFSDEARSLWTLSKGEEWKSASDLMACKCGEKSLTADV